ncbi:hypothetical protein PGB90_005311 [Kerria lacca]
MSKKGSTKSRTETSSDEINKITLNRSGHIPQAVLKDENKDKNYASDTTFKTIKSRIEANIARKFSGKRSKSITRKSQTKKMLVTSSPKIDNKDELHPNSMTTVNDDQRNCQKSELLALEIEKLRGRLELTMNKNKQLEEENTKIFQNREQTMKTIKNLLSQNRELTAENATFKERHNRESETINDLKIKMQILETRVQKLTEENRILNEANLKILKDLQSTEQEKNDLNKSYRSQYDEISRLSQERQKDTTKLQEADHRYAKLKSDLMSTTKQLDSLRSDIKKYRDIVDELKTENKKLKSVIQTNKGSSISKAPDSTDSVTKFRPKK